MVVVAKGSRPFWPTARQVALRQARIRERWSPWERRERARHAKAQANLLWAIICEGAHTHK
jgi:hypothetical protein